MSATALPSNSGLIFHWEAPWRGKLAIAGFLAVSLAAHALCFYIFQIIYPPAVALLPPPARVSMITASSEEGRTMLRWIEAEDPALAAITQRPADAKTIPFPKLDHVPSYVSTQPALKELPPIANDLNIPTARPPAPVTVRQERKIQTTVAVPTTIDFSEEFAGLGKIQKPEMKFSASTREPPQSAQFRAAATERGDLRYCFLQRSSGDAALDDQAQKSLALCRFSGASPEKLTGQNQLIWGTATIEWGNDIVLPPSSSAESATP